jgi:zinc/manganese transport system ATP-binding protein
VATGEPNHQQRGTRVEARDGAAAHAAITLCDAEVRVGGRTIWSGAQLKVRPGEFTAVLGPNGAGKTTLLRVLLGELKPSRGEVRVLGRPPGHAGAQIGYLPQRRHFTAGVPIRGVDLVRLGLDGARWGLRRRRRDGDQVEEALATVGASAYARRPIGRLSGGEQQRLLIAQALVSGPQLLILDEPLDGLDLPNQMAVAAMLGEISGTRGVTVLLVAHDVNPLLAHLDRVVYFGGGHAASGTPREVINGETLSRLYGAPVEVLESASGRLVVLGAPDAEPHHGAHHHHS